MIKQASVNKGTLKKNITVNSSPKPISCKRTISKMERKREFEQYNDWNKDHLKVLNKIDNH